MKGTNSLCLPCCSCALLQYDELAAKLSGVDSVVIAKMDATANEIDVEGVNVQGFPTIMFFPGDDKVYTLLTTLLTTTALYTSHYLLVLSNASADAACYSKSALTSWCC
jgi:Thioredoxin